VIPIDTSRCLAHVLICVNRRVDSMPGCVGRVGTDGEEIFEAFRSWITARGLLGKIWLSRTACLGWCHPDGVTVVIYPQGHWYRAVTLEDCHRLIDEHLAGLAADA
jgi:(2Fe-2S) ferredoxin